MKIDKVVNQIEVHVDMCSVSVKLYHFNNPKFYYSPIKDKIYFGGSGDASGVAVLGAWDGIAWSTIPLSHDDGINELLVPVMPNGSGIGDVERVLQLSIV
ncbi:MAG: hypothetical protein QM642_00335, partial [Edaphocola sp.]